jgi:hypothetical protein
VAGMQQRIERPYRAIGVANFRPPAGKRGGVPLRRNTQPDEGQEDEALCLDTTGEAYHQTDDDTSRNLPAQSPSAIAMRSLSNIRERRCGETLDSFRHDVGNDQSPNKPVIDETPPPFSAMNTSDRTPTKA